MPKRTKPEVLVPPAPTAPGGAKPMPHADSPTLAASSGEFDRCKTCGTAVARGARCAVDGRVAE
jgi:hypothetical protein